MERDQICASDSALQRADLALDALQSAFQAGGAVAARIESCMGELDLETLRQVRDLLETLHVHIQSVSSYTAHSKACIRRLSYRLAEYNCCTCAETADAPLRRELKRDVR